MLNIKLVGEVEKHIEMFNYQLAAYSRRDITEKSWYEVTSNILYFYIFFHHLTWLYNKFV